MATNDRFVYRTGRFIRAALFVLLLAAGLLALVLSAAGQEDSGSAVNAGRAGVEPVAPGDPNAPTAGSNVWGNPLPEQINYQGQLVDNNGLPQSGVYTLTFNVLSSPPGFALLYSESQTVTTDADGLFDVMIGSVQPGLRNALDGGAAWLEVALNGELLAPRQPIGSVAYALYAQHLAGGTGPDSVIAGGRSNSAGGNESVVGGGLANAAAGTQSAVSGGWTNSAGGTLAAIGGGSFNTADSTGATIGGGSQNSVTGTLAIVGGGFANSARGNYATTSGGRNNDTFADYATVGGGQGNDVYATHATISGGDNNEVTDVRGTVGGGAANVAGDTATVGGGLSNAATGREATIGGGAVNSATGFNATVGGGLSNSAGGSEAAIGGGSQNTTTAENATVGGGEQNSATGNYTAIAGGRLITASGEYASVGGGLFNTASGTGSIVPGGEYNEATAPNSFAAGLYAGANHTGAFVWSGTSQVFTSTNNYQFLVDAPGGVGINTNFPFRQMHVLDTYATPAFAESSVVLIENDAANDSGTGSYPDALSLLLSNVVNPGASNDFISFYDQNNTLGAIQGNGSGGVSYASFGSDFAEYLPLHADAARDPEPGTVMGLKAGILSVDTVAADRVMVVSTAPAFVGNWQGVEEIEGMALVAFMGQVPVRVRGPVQAGGLLVASGLNDGTAVAITAARLTPDLGNQIVGQALESSRGPGLSLVNTLVGQPTDAFWATRLAESEARLADLEARLAQLEAALAGNP